MVTVFDKPLDDEISALNSNLVNLVKSATYNSKTTDNFGGVLLGSTLMNKKIVEVTVSGGYFNSYIRYNGNLIVYVTTNDANGFIKVVPQVTVDITVKYID